MPIGRITETAREALAGLNMPKLGLEVEIAIYVVHNSEDAEDYFFIFDFEAFVERSRAGLFARPRLKVWAGRDDFSRRVFARQFREAFGREFDAARAALRAEKSRPRGWFDWDLGKEISGALIPNLMANVILILATTTGRAVWRGLGLPQGKSDEVRLEESIEATQTKVDDALAALEVRLHMALYRHAWGGTQGPLKGVDYDAWPLPEHVTQHLNDGATQAWW